jgi:hypothetical protein
MVPELVEGEWHLVQMFVLLSALMVGAGRCLVVGHRYITHSYLLVF